MSKHPSLILEVCQRFDALKAVGVSRHAEKERLRAAAAVAGHPLVGLAPSTGRIHADKTLDTYKPMALRYARWARDHHGVRHLADLDAQAIWLVNQYLAECLEAGDSPYTVQTTRSALRMLHRPAFPPDEREERVTQLGAGIAIPRRKREEITRSRGHVAMDDHIDLARYQPIIDFCRATGVRRRELEGLVVGDVHAVDGPSTSTGGGPGTDGGLVVEVDNGKGGKWRLVPVLPGREQSVRGVIAGRPPLERIFPHIPVRLDVHGYRRTYAQDLYCEDGRRPLPQTQGRLRMETVDLERALYVSQALGHSRIDVMLRHYLR